MIDTEILDDYCSEARELLDEMDNSLMRLEKEGGTPELLNTIFRAVHCIKGSAEYIGLERSSTLTHGVENLLDRLRENAMKLTPAVVDFLFRAKDLISILISEVSQHRVERSEISLTMEQLDRFLAGTATEPADMAPEMPRAEITQREPSFEEARTTEEVPEFPVVPEEELGEFLPIEEMPTVLVEEEAYPVEYFPEIEATEAAEERPPVLEALPGEAALPEAPEEFVTRGEEEMAEAVGELEEPGAIEQFSLEDTVPHILSISLYLDDLEDGLNVEEALSSMVQKLKLLREHEGFRGIPEALDILEAMERHASLVETGEGPVPFPEIDRLRSLLFDLRYHYPEEKFPLEARRPTEPEQPPVEAEPAIADAVSSFIAQLEKVPGMERSVIDALLQAGFSSMESLAGQGISDLSKIPGVAPSLARAILTAAGVTPPAPPERPVARARPERSLLADVDDELLHEFEGIFAAGPSLAGEPQRVSPRARGQRAADLLEELDAVSAESDREIMEIFLSYGWEILDKLRPVVRKISLGHADRSELDRAAELIKAIRSSSTYMDYQNLASFLDDWYEKTLWTSERFDSLSPRDTAFMEERLLRFDDFLVGLETVVNPDAAQGGADRLASARRPAPAPPFVHGQPQVGAAKGVRPMPTSVADQASPRRAKPPIVPAADEALLVETPTRDLGVEVPIPPGPLAPSAGPTEGQQPLEAPIGEPAAPLVFGADFPQEGALVKTMRVDSSKVDVLLNRVGELVVNRAFVEQLSSELKSFQRVLVSTPGVTKREVAVIKELALKVTEASVSLGRVANDIQEGVMKLRMLPVGQLFNRMPRLIRDLSRRVGKTVNLEVYGGDTEVDKRVIEQIYNPLVHLIRNAVDHGIEDAETRKGRGKSEEGSITLRAYSEGNQVVIDVEDDGGGIDKDAVIRRAVESRLIDVQDAKNISMQEIYNFLFLPGFSTSDKVTRTSGRGVGMDVVKKDVEKINGRVELESWEDQGTRISIRIPLTLAIIQTLLIRSRKHVFAMPLTSVREIIRIAPHEIETIEGFEVIKFRDETIPVLRVAEIFNLRKTDAARPAKFLVIATAGQKITGFLVEELIGEQDVVIKPLAEHVCEIRGLAGSTVLGDGTIALVMDVNEIVDDIIFQQRQLSLQGTRAMAARGEARAPTRA